MRIRFADWCLLGLLLLRISITPVSGQNVSEEVLDEDVDKVEVPLFSGNGTNMTEPTAAPSGGTMPPTSEDGCYYSLDAIYNVISDDDKLFEPKRFVICPGTLINVGFLVPGLGIDKGQAPLVPRSNTEFLCGEDGKSENNCTIKGGDFGLIAVPVFFRQDVSVNNVQVRGFTFVGQTQYASFIATHGEIDFYDCIFRDSNSFGTMVYSFDSSIDLTRRLEGADEEFLNPWDHALSFVERYRSGSLPRRLAAEEEIDTDLLPRNRDLQTYQEGDVFKGLVQDCLYTNLNQVERQLGVDFGIFSVKGPDHFITVVDTTFSNNKYGDRELTPIGYGMLFQGCELNLTGLCFIDNDFRGNAAILLEETKDPFVEGTNMMTANYVTEEDADLDCPFAAYYATVEDRQNSVFTCIPPQASECGGENIPLPTGGTIPAPNAGTIPTPTPSSAPSVLVSRFALIVGVIGAFNYL